MSSNPVVLNPVTVNDELKAAVATATSPEAIRAAILAEAQKQGDAGAVLTAAEAEATRKAAEAAAAKADEDGGAGFKRTENIGGRDFEFEADSEVELERMVANAYKVAYNVQPVEAAPAPAAAVVVTKTEEEKVAERTALETKFRLGEITASDYIEQSGALDSYLEKKGLSIDSLKNTVEQNEVNQFEKSWATATEEFLHSAAGADWPGGERNLQLIGQMLATPDPVTGKSLMDATDKVAAIAQVWNGMKSKNLYFPAEGAAPAAAAAAAAADPAPVVPAAAAAAAPAPVVPAAPAPRAAAGSSSLFGASSGVSGGAAAAAPAATKVDVPADASPAEIIDAWKKEQLRLGKDPNAAFVENFAAKRG